MPTGEDDFIYVTPIEQVEDDGDNDEPHYILCNGISHEQSENHIQFNSGEDNAGTAEASPVHDDDPNIELEDQIIVLVEESETEIELQAREAKEKRFESTCRLCAEHFDTNDQLLPIFSADQSILDDMQILLNDVVRYNTIVINQLVNN